jgi:hypothetical protein
MFARDPSPPQTDADDAADAEATADDSGPDHQPQGGFGLD